MITAAPVATATPARIQAEYAPLASIKYLEPGTPAPRFTNGEWIISQGTHFRYGDYVQVGKSRLVFQTDGNLVLYDELGQARWASGTDKRGQEGIFQQDGNLVVYVSRGRPFASRTCCQSDTLLSVRADGNMWIYKPGVVLWQTGTAH